MVRPLRVEFSGALYHLSTRGNDRREIFVSDCNRIKFLKILAKVVKSHNWMCHAYCLMDNHYHLLIETPEGNLSKGMRDLNSSYAQVFNNTQGRDGHVFKGRFYSSLIEKETYLLEVARYIVLNPVRAKIVNHPRDWKWSSFRATAGYTKSERLLTTDWILNHFSEDRTLARQEYRKFVLDGIDSGNPFVDVVEGNILGYPQFVDFVWGLNPDVDKLKEIPKRERMLGRPKLKDLFTKCKGKKDRNRMIEIAFFRCAYSQREIADFLKIHYSSVSKIIKNSRFKT
ncbi:MAG: transposase [Patescibacteria group bacterium]|nr:transposase [Patescibacteria group bacterium]